MAQALIYLGWAFAPVTLVLLIAAVFWRTSPRFLPALVGIHLIVLTVVFLGADIAAGASSSQPSWTTWLTFPTLSHFHANPHVMNLVEYKSAVSTVLGTALATVTIWFAVLLPYRSVGALQDEIRRSEIVEIRPISKKGVDDIKTLTDLLELAHEAKMFAGSYDWLIKPEDESPDAGEATEQLRKVIKRMIDKKSITFVSDKKTRDTVISGLKAIDSEFADQFASQFNIEHGTDERIMLTLVKYDNPKRAICSRVNEVPRRSSTKTNNIIVRSDTPGGDVLIHIIERLIESAASPKKAVKKK